MSKRIKQQSFLIPTLLFLLIGLSTNMLWAKRDIPSKPQHQTAVYDDAGFLNSSEKKALEQKLIKYADTTSTQIVVASINSLEGEYIGTYAAEWAHEWGIGQKGKDNGVLILIAKDDRKFWITTGKGVEGELTDALSKRISDQVISPAFQNGQYYNGLDAATDKIMEILSGEFDNDFSAEEEFPWKALIPLLFFIIFFIVVSQRHGGGKGGNGTKSNSNWLFDAILLSSFGRGGGSGFGGGNGGGFGGGGFGGGGFGGGGAGGSW